MNTNQNENKNTKGFTLIEILLAIGILAILATAAIIAINPARQFAEARNTQRWDDVRKLMSAVYQYTISHKGAFPPEVPSGGSMLEICQTDAPSCSGLVSMTSLSDNALYLPTMPIDPSCPSGCAQNGTGYFITLDQHNRLDIQAPGAELDETIELTQ